MIRLIYLLMRQRLQRSGPAVAGRQRRLVQGAMVLGLAVGVGVGAYALSVEWRVQARSSPDAPRAPGDGATLRLRVAAVESPPLLVFLQAPGAADVQRAGGPPPTVQIKSVGVAFEPAFQVAPLAARVQVGNADPVAHNTHVFDGRSTLFNVALPHQGVEVSRVIARAGLFQVRCDLHAWMRATMFVPPGPHYRVIRQAGEFELRDIAPGPYKLHVWTAAGGETVQTIDLAPGAARSLDLPAR